VPNLSMWHHCVEEGSQHHFVEKFPLEQSWRVGHVKAGVSMHLSGATMGADWQSAQCNRDLSQVLGTCVQKPRYQVEPWIVLFQVPEVLSVYGPRFAAGPVSCI
jgi:hypothetical protein